MKSLHITIGVFLFVVLVGGASLLLYGALDQAAWDAWMKAASGWRTESMAVGGGVLFTVVLYALTGLNLPRREQYLAYESEGGGVTISLKAVENFLARLSYEFAAVVSLQPTLRLANGAVDVQLDIKVKSGARIPELCKLLQEAARACLRDKVGISDVREVRVRVQEIIGATSSGDTSSGDMIGIESGLR